MTGPNGPKESKPLARVHCGKLSSSLSRSTAVTSLRKCSRRDVSRGVFSAAFADATPSSPSTARPEYERGAGITAPCAQNEPAL